MSKSAAKAVSEAGRLAEMCSACGVLQGGPEWLDCAGPEGPRLAERQKRLRLVNRMLAPSGTKVSDAAGKLVLRSPTGRVRIVDDLAHLWVAAAEIGRAPVDPLAPDQGTRAP